MVERANAWLLENKRFGLGNGRLGVIVESLLQVACVFPASLTLDRKF